MSITTDCAEGRHAVCRGAGPNHHFPQTSHLGDQPCACSCHVGRGHMNAGEQGRTFTITRAGVEGIAQLTDDELQRGVTVIEVGSGHDEQTEDRKGVLYTRQDVLSLLTAREEQTEALKAERDKLRRSNEGLLDAIERLNESKDRLHREVADLQSIAGLPLIESERAARQAEAALATERERTVAAVVEALREYGRVKVDGVVLGPPHPPDAPVSLLADFIEERFGSSVSGGD